jgi:hypothetical protein
MCECMYLFPFSIDMRAYFDSGGCGAVNYIDVYNMTSALALQLPAEAEKLTYDGVHWGMEVSIDTYIHTYIHTDVHDGDANFFSQ